jgi:hypothetical protein
MNGFLYFLPGLNTITPEHLAKIEGNVINPRSYSSRLVGSGPGDQSGMLVCDARQDCKYLTTQTWHEVANGTYWIGYNTKPTPNDLMRDDAIDGHYVTLNDGNHWLVPVLRLIEGGLPLPQHQQLYLNTSGEWCVELKPEFVELGRRVDAIWDAFKLQVGLAEPQDDDMTLTLDLKLDITHEALGINYRVSRWETSILRLFNLQNTQPILEAIIDYPSLKMMAQKKTLIDV